MDTEKIRNFTRKIKPPISPAEFQRSFWIQEVNEMWSDDMKIYELIDRSKLKRHLTHESQILKLKAKIIYLNKLLDECNPSL